mmetsp:Transcript_37438/g.60138  ORF Transcript_37438/g.60138 Transcript_37438/m.60138 type:complete len:248 (+) Transcript_37438:501-1244(+)
MTTNDSALASLFPCPRETLATTLRMSAVYPPGPPPVPPCVFECTPRPCAPLVRAQFAGVRALSMQQCRKRTLQQRAGVCLRRGRRCALSCTTPDHCGPGCGRRMAAFSLPAEMYPPSLLDVTSKRVPSPRRRRCWFSYHHGPPRQMTMAVPPASHTLTEKYLANLSILKSPQMIGSVSMSWRLMPHSKSSLVPLADVEPPQPTLTILLLPSLCSLPRPQPPPQALCAILRLTAQVPLDWDCTAMFPM